jgi:formylglycine-generating enzyme required for sulfatase activity
MVCIEGAVFVRGDTTSVIDDRQVVKAAPERLVRVSPFALDRNETSVREMRALVEARKVEAPRSRSADSPACTYTDAPGEFEDYPVSCVSRASAVRACAARGLRLPTEAEWELAAGDGAEERRYPWGADPDVCRYAVLARGRALTEGAIDLSTVCRTRPGAPPLPWGPRPIAEGDDVTASGLRHMSGNVSEWVADAAGAYAGPCSEGPPLLVDPRCDRGELGLVLVRGGNWMLPPYRAQTVLRGTYATDDGVPEVGFRCAESM